MIESPTRSMHGIGKNLNKPSIYHYMIDPFERAEMEKEA